MKYVLDASVGIKTVLPESDSDKAVVLRTDFRAGVHELIAPDTYLVEIAHALTRAGRRGIVQIEDVSVKIHDLLIHAPVLHPYILLLARAVEISNEFRIGVYDCLYVALAEREHCELVTADERLIKSLQGQFPFLVLLSDMS